MKVLPVALLTGLVAVSHPALAQTAAPEQPPSPSAPAASGQETGTTAPITTRQMTVSDLKAERLKGKDGVDLGDITGVVESSADQKTYLVVSSGGILGFFGTEHLVPLDQVVVSANDGVIAANMTQAQIETAPPLSGDTHKALNETQKIGIPEQR